MFHSMTYDDNSNDVTVYQIYIIVDNHMKMRSVEYLVDVMVNAIDDSLKPTEYIIK